MEGCRGQRATRGAQPEGRRTAGGRRAAAAASSGFPRPFSLSPSIGFNHHSHFLYRSPTPSARPLALPGWGLGLGLRQPLRLGQFPTPPSGLVTRAAGCGSSARPASARPPARPRSSPVCSCFHSSPPPGSDSGNSLSAPSCQTGSPPLVTSAALPFSTPLHRFLSR